jgi:hypothetical protein
MKLKDNIKEAIKYYKQERKRHIGLAQAELKGGLFYSSNRNTRDALVCDEITRALQELLQ